MPRRATLVTILGLALAVALPAAGQDASPALGVPRGSPVLTLDQDRLFSSSAFGKRVADTVDAASHDLAAENRKIETELTDEEKALTDKRSTLPPEDFRKLADAFDAKVEGIRRDQASKARDIGRLRDRERQRFFQAAVPILGQIVRDAGAVAILNSQAIVLSFDSIDITDEAVRRIDASLGDGGPIPAPDAPPPAGDAPAGAAGDAAPPPPASGN